MTSERLEHLRRVTDEFLTRPAQYVLSEMQWRTGRKVGRTIYAQLGPSPSDDDPLIGVMDTPALASDAVRAHNLTTET